MLFARSDVATAEPVPPPGPVAASLGSSSRDRTPETKPMTKFATKQPTPMLGLRFGTFSVIEGPLPNPAGFGAAYWLCRCDCGREAVRRGNSLRAGYAIKCACRRKVEVPRAPRSVDERFWSKVDRNGPVPSHVPHLGPCWIWIGARNSKGYGSFYLNGVVQLAARVAWQLTHGRESTQWVLHACDGGALGCVRPEHLFEGTAQDNVDDMMSKGRHRVQRLNNQDRSFTQ